MGAPKKIVGFPQKGDPHTCVEDPPRRNTCFVGRKKENLKKPFLI